MLFVAFKKAFHLPKTFSFFLVGFKGNLSLLDICLYFSQAALPEKRRRLVPDRQPLPGHALRDAPERRPDAELPRRMRSSCVLPFSRFPSAGAQRQLFGQLVFLISPWSF